jgi:hypothetical protein
MCKNPGFESMALYVKGAVRIVVSSTPHLLTINRASSKHTIKKTAMANSYNDDDDHYLTEVNTYLAMDPPLMHPDKATAFNFVKYILQSSHCYSEAIRSDIRDRALAHTGSFTPKQRRIIRNPPTFREENPKNYSDNNDNNDDNGLTWVAYDGIDDVDRYLGGGEFDDGMGFYMS